MKLFVNQLKNRKNAKERVSAAAAVFLLQAKPETDSLCTAENPIFHRYCPCRFFRNAVSPHLLLCEDEENLPQEPLETGDLLQDKGDPVTPNGIAGLSFLYQKRNLSSASNPFTPSCRSSPGIPVLLFQAGRAQQRQQAAR